MKNIIIFGCGKAGTSLYKEINGYINVIGFSDNNLTLHNTNHCTKTVIPPCQLSSYKYDFIVIASMYHQEIRIKLIKKYKILEKNIINQDQIKRLIKHCQILEKEIKSTNNTKIDSLLMTLLLEQFTQYRFSMYRLSFVLKKILDGKQLTIDMLQSSVIGMQAYESFLRIPIAKKGLIKDTNSESIIQFSSRSANQTLTKLISREIPLLIDEDFDPFTKYAIYNWEESQFTIKDEIFNDFFYNNGDLFKEFVAFKDTKYGIQYLNSENKESLNLNTENNLLSFSEEEKEAGIQFLKNIAGIKESDWYVCIYARDGGYYKEDEDHRNWFRNSDINTYHLAIDEIIKRGGNVIRVGSQMTTKLKYQHPKVFDYSNSIYQSDFLDIFLLSQCKFFLGSHSGLAHVNTVFNTPQLLVNVINCHGGTSDIWIPKKIIDIDSGKFISFYEFFNRYNDINDKGLLCENGINQAKYLNIKYIDNSAEEIYSATIDMFNKLTNKKHTLKNMKTRNKLKELLNLSLDYFNIADSFIDQNQKLFELTKE